MTAEDPSTIYHLLSSSVHSLLKSSTHEEEDTVTLQNFKSSQPKTGKELNKPSLEGPKDTKRLKEQRDIVKEQREAVPEFFKAIDIKDSDTIERIIRKLHDSKTIIESQCFTDSKKMFLVRYLPKVKVLLATALLDSLYFAKFSVSDPYEPAIRIIDINHPHFCECKEIVESMKKTDPYNPSLPRLLLRVSVYEARFSRKKEEIENILMSAIGWLQGLEHSHFGSKEYGVIEELYVELACQTRDPSKLKSVFRSSRKILVIGLWRFHTITGEQDYFWSCSSEFAKVNRKSWIFTNSTCRGEWFCEKSMIFAEIVRGMGNVGETDITTLIPLPNSDSLFSQRVSAMQKFLSSSKTTNREYEEFII